MEIQSEKKRCTVGKDQDGSQAQANSIILLQENQTSDWDLETAA